MDAKSMGIKVNDIELKTLDIKQREEKKSIPKNLKSTDLVKITFARPTRNVKITDEMYKNCRQEYLEEIKSEHGKKLVLPNEYYSIMHKVFTTHGAPYIFETLIEYEMSKEDADHYLSKYNIEISPGEPIHIKNVQRDLYKHQEKVYLAELVA